MKLHKFSAKNMTLAMADIFEELGPEAMIYHTRNFPGGVEVVAGLQAEKQLVEPAIHAPAAIDMSVMDRLATQLQNIDAQMKQLALQVHQSGSQDRDFSASPQEKYKQNMLAYHLDRMHVVGKFADILAQEFLAKDFQPEHFEARHLEAAMIKHIKTESKEFIENKNIIALIGPTGIGKTTTIAKLAKRYISRYGAKSLGLITADYNDIAKKNHLSYYSQLLDVDLEYANDEIELDSALKMFQDKRLILIDTYGSSQRDNANMANLLNFIESQGDRISTYLTLPCNVQESILDEISRAFQTVNLKGCILTKQDESISIAPAVSMSVSYRMPIAYVCTGQNINTDIEKAEPHRILTQIMTESVLRKQSAEQHLFRNMNRIQEFRLGA